MSCVTQTEGLIDRPNACLCETKMQSHIGNNSLRKVYYVIVGGTSLIPVPSERIVELKQLRSEQHRMQAEAGIAMAGVRRN